MRIKIFILSLLFLHQALLAVESALPRSLSLLDHRGNTYLFRGKTPVVEGIFLEEELREAILQFEGVTLPQDFKLILVSLMNRFGDFKEVASERKWEGELYRYPLFGAFFSPSCFPKPARSLLYIRDTDGLCRLMARLDAMMEENKTEDTVIYLHCFAGKDRTGEASSCYLMQFKGCSYQDAVMDSERIARRPLNAMSMNAIRSYAYYLKEACFFDTIGAID